MHRSRGGSRPLNTWLALVVILLGAATLPDSDDLTETLERASIATHDAPVLFVAYDEKGKHLATATERDVTFWETKSGEAAWTTRTVSASGLGVTEDGEVVVGLRGVAVVSRYDGETGEKLTGGSAGYAINAKGTCADVDREGRWAWIGTEEGVVARVSWGSGGASTRPLGNGGVTCLAVDPEGEFVAVGGQDGTIRSLTAGGATREEVMEHGGGAVRAVAFGPKGKVVVSGGKDGTVKLWDPKKGDLDLTLPAHDAAVVAIAVDPKRKWIASADASGLVRFASFKRGEPLARLRVADDAAVQAMVVSPDGSTLATVAAEDRTVTLWDVKKVF